jgi:DNA-binding transcriptional regulator YiaG
MTFKELRALSRMTFKSFSEYFEIPVRTLQDWEYGKRVPAPYLMNLMVYKLKKENII